MSPSMPVFPLICRNLPLIEADERLFWCVLPGSAAAFAFGGSFPVPVGVWAQAWKRGLGVRRCGSCGGDAYWLFTNGAMSLGWSGGFCSVCGAAWGGKEWAPSIWAFLKNEIEVRIAGRDAAPAACSFEELLARLGA